LQNWAIALVAAARGRVDEIAIRLPSVVAMLLTIALVYGYCRSFLAPLGALAAAAALATMGHVLEFAWIGETEAMYTLFVGGALLAWRWLDAAGKPAVYGWCAGYGLAAMGMLSKGPQALCYFLGGVGLYLWFSGRWRALFGWPHLVGFSLFLAVWVAWEIPFFRRVGPENAWKMFVGDIALRFIDNRWLVLGKHMASFPIELAVCMLPWSVLLGAYLWREYRSSVRFAAEHLRFLACAILWAFLICWLVPGARNRYFAPLYPCVAPWIGLVVQQCAEAPAVAPWVLLWKRYLRGLAVCMAGLGGWVLAVTWLGWGAAWGAQPPWFAAVYAGAAVAAGILAWGASCRAWPVGPRLGILAVAGFLGLSLSGVMINAFVAQREPIRENVAELKRQLPAGTRLVSLGQIDFNFAYYYEEPIQPLPLRSGEPGEDAPWTYFCVNDRPGWRERGFAYEQLAVVSCEPFRTPRPAREVIVGRRLETARGFR
jgi:4-amino-4-deoxy-L-arabinose transferase-like glycosyltransferase